MNKIYRAAGRWSIGIATLTGTMALAADGDAKPLTLALGLKGFYDDNIFTRPSGPEKVDSFGLQVVPSIAYKVSNGATSVSIGYTLDAKWFERRSRDSVDASGAVAQKADPWDYSHYIKANIKHKFSDTVSIQADDSFAITREPQEFLSGQVARSKGDAIINYAGLKGEVGLTDSFGLALSYRNNLFDYSDPNYKPLLNRMENIPSVDLRYRINPTLYGILGYRYSNVAYDKNQILPVDGSTSVVYSDARNRSSHFVYGGADWQASPVLSFAARAGGEFTEYSNLEKYKLKGNKSDTSPFADVSAKWQFAKDSYLNGGLRHQLNATDALYASSSGNNIVLSQESTLLYAVLAHNITPALRVSVNGQFQDSVYNGGTYDGKSEQFYGGGLTFSYALNAYLSAEASYLYDKLATSSEPALAARSFSRNRVFLGIRASY